MTRHLRTIAAVAGVIGTLAALSACSLLGPARDADGRVTEPSEINSPTLLVGDCFSFVDGTSLAKVTVTPCANDHAYIVIGDGSLSSGQIDKDGGLQNAVSAACSDVFTESKPRRPTARSPNSSSSCRPRRKTARRSPTICASQRMRPPRSPVRTPAD